MPAEDGAPATDRRGRRRLETVEEILDVAAEIMAEQGAGGLTLGELARRMGIRPPSLYGYVDSKTALYDALFERGWTRLNQTMATQLAGVGDAPEPTAQALTAAETFVRWSVENAAYAQLMFWRPVPGFEPSARAYAPALEAMRGAREAFAVLQDRGVLDQTSDLDEALDAWVVIVSGVVSQQLSNAPHESFEQGTFTRLLPQLMSMFMARYGAEGGTDDRTNGAAARGRTAADQPKRGTRGGRSAARRDPGSAARTRRG
jgi:AcrR family transcriptional regulator